MSLKSLAVTPLARALPVLVLAFAASAATAAERVMDKTFSVKPGGVINVNADAAGITVNKNAVPFDEKPPAVASGIRLGTPIVSTRGMREKEMGEIVALIDRVLQKPSDKRAQREVRHQAKALCKRFPMFYSYDSSPT